MDDYYIRTPENDRSRGPFDVDKLISLAEAGQVTENTLYYDEEQEEWKPIGLNESLKASIFPKRKRLSLATEKTAGDSATAEDQPEEEEEEHVDVQEILAAADGETEETRHLKKGKESMEKASAVAPSGLAASMGLSGLFLLFPHFGVLQEAFGEGSVSDLLGFPFFLVALLDLFLALALLLAVTEVYPYVRGRAMIGLGFGVYLGWVLQSPELILVFFLAGLGPFTATFAKRLSLTIAALVIAVIANGYLAYLSLTGRFDGFFESVQISL
ncbi:MAG: DUF4339 domain-containing protein [Opitutales bacterium]